jgi:hypothetical protein
MLKKHVEIEGTLAKDKKEKKQKATPIINPDLFGED